MLLDSIRSTLHDGPRFGRVRLLSSAGVRIADAAGVADAPDAADAAGGRTFAVTADKPGAPGTIALTWPLSDSRMFWKVGMRPSGPAQPADWDGRVPVSLVNSAPMGCLLDSADRNVLAFAYSYAKDEVLMRYGVDEERAMFTVVLDVARMPGASELLLTDRHGMAADVIRALSRWMGRRTDRFPMSPEALEPVFSTWYAYLQRIDADELLAQADGIRGLGCRSVFVDDGWQAFGHGRGYAGCGDWVPDTGKFPDLAACVARLRERHGLTTVLWVAPLLLGERSEAFARMAPYAPLPMDGDPDCGCRVLDPRRAVVRDHIADVCARLMRRYGIGGLKIDFLDQARAYQGRPLDDPACGDVDDVGEAMRMMLAQVRDVMLAQCDGVPIVEFRQPYSSPAIAPYSNVVRASDCPSDAATNRVRIVDERLVSTRRVVHGDMLLWHPQAGAEACAEQIMGSFFAVPQISVRPSAMSEEQRAACRYLLRVWRDHRDVLLGGGLDPVGVTDGYPLVSAYGDGGQVSAVYARGMVVDVDVTRTGRLLVLNASREPAVALRLHGDGRSVHVAGDAHDCRGNVVTTWDEPIAAADDAGGGEAASGAGFLRLPAPAYGVLDLSVR